MLWVVMARLAVAPVVIARIVMTPVAVARAGLRHSVQRARIAAPTPLPVLLTLSVLRPPRGMAPLSGEVAALAVLPPPQEMTPLSMLRPPQEVATIAVLLALPLPQPLWEMAPVAAQAFLARRRLLLAARAQAAQGAVRDRAA